MNQQMNLLSVASGYLNLLEWWCDFMTIFLLYGDQALQSMSSYILILNIRLIFKQQQNIGEVITEPDRW